MLKRKMLMILIGSLILSISCKILEREEEPYETKENVKQGAFEIDENPSVTKGKVQKRKEDVDEVRIGHFETPLLDQSESRIHNIRLAAERLDRFKVNPNDEFSFNRVVGKRTKEKGYEEAPIIILKSGSPDHSDAIGGGICQLSGTLYNAVLDAGLEVTERHPHSKKVPYAEEGQDATVDFDRYDFKFVNTRENPIVLKVDVYEDTLSVDILEKRDLSARS